MTVQSDLSFRSWLLVSKKIIRDSRQLVASQQGAIGIVFYLVEGMGIDLRVARP